ncbi:hypothetical protein ASG51_20730 [Methylobacterium sp. Leaf465]|uniref:hypothetical protein n=1 Tax=Methylobacterium sp. Leaf465 TaxID=1736385 RepID=UPI0006F3642E|nr:hypothetical protein [Methylobacterium sp. Leaf465]KQT81096.1 hypothetical protein ASG51_20730 [Methylobacterium sp. Leaf465]
MAELRPLYPTDALPPLRAGAPMRSAGPAARPLAPLARGLAVLAVVALGTLVLGSAGQRTLSAAKDVTAATEMPRVAATRLAAPRRMVAASDLSRAN